MTADEAIAECAQHQVCSVVRAADSALVEGEIGGVVAYADDHGEYCDGDVLGCRGY